MTKKEWFTVEEVATELDVSRATVYNYVKLLRLKTKKFPANRHRFLSHKQVETIRKYRAMPWDIEE